MDEELIKKVVDRIREKARDNRIEDYGIVRYVEHGAEPGGFLSNVLENNLTGAAVHADDYNKRRLYEWADLVYNCVPMDARNSKENMTRWMAHRGMRGLLPP